MKKAMAAVCFLMMLFCSPFPAAAEILDFQSHQDWHSFIVNDPQGSVARMITRDGKTIMVLDVETGGEYRISLLETVPEDDQNMLDFLEGMELSGKMRVDKRTMYDVSFRLHAMEGGLRAELLGIFHEQLLAEARKGSMLRMKVDTVEPLYLSFSLRGFSAALNRCMKLSRIIEKMNPPDSEYFNDPSPDFRSRSGGSQGDEAYFL